MENEIEIYKYALRLACLEIARTRKYLGGNFETHKSVDELMQSFVADAKKHMNDEDENY